jgi:hypothetical protein
MTTSELISYIKKQIKNNIPKDLIISKLTGAGWHRKDIDEGFLDIELESKLKNFLPDIKKELPKIEPPKVWVPHNLPILEKPQTMVVEEQELELPAKTEAKFDLVGSPDSSKEAFREKEELIPTLMPKVVINSFGSINKDNFGRKEEPIVSSESSKNYLIKDLPKSAMLSSYKSDLLSVNKIKEEKVKKKSSKVVKRIIIAFVVFIIVLIIWAFTIGYVNIKNPKILLLNNSEVLSSLKSYKTETNIEISSPSFANISAGLISGEAVSSADKDSISINTLGVINQNEGSILSDNFITIKSSLLQNYITTDIKNNGSNLFVSVPDLSQVVGKDAPEPSVVKIDENQFNLIPSLFSLNIESELKKMNIYRILSSGMPSYIKNITLSVYNELINDVDIIEKGEENIKGVDTYHYLINADRQSTKKLLSEISNNFVLNLSDGDKDRLTQILGSVTIDSFEVWIGKGDNNIYQYNVILDIPLSKIIDFEDKSIGDNKVFLDWKTTYYDFNSSNNISMPETSILVTDFINDIKEKKIRNNVSSFGQFAQSLFNAEGVYGSKPNSNGSCMNPVSGSLFSPTGHTKGATTAVSSLSELLNKILKTTDSAGFCYSTTKAWSFTIPISDNYDISSVPTLEYKSFFCVDNTGATLDLTVPPTGVICK